MNWGYIGIKFCQILLMKAKVTNNNQWQCNKNEFVNTITNSNF